MKLRQLLILFGMLIGTIPVIANPVIVKMNAVSRTMTIKPVDTDETIEIGTPTTSYEYNLNLNPGKYEVTGYGTDGNTVNGKIMINVTDSLTTQQFTVITCTAYVTNKLEDGSTPWNIENGDYALNVKVNTREGEKIEQTPGRSVTANRYTFLALNGNSYNVAFEPSEEHQAEGYMTLYRGGTLTANVNVTGAIPMGGDFSITIPAEAELEVGMKFTHFTDFTPIKPTSIENANGGVQYNFTLANGQVYNYRAWKPGGLTHGGYFTMNTVDKSKCPVISFTDADFSKADPKAINHSPQSNNGYETGDILLNINPRHHLTLKSGEEFLVHGMRMWELSDNSTNNYFFEPDFHYTVLDENFKPSDDVVEIDNADTNVSAWSTLKAKAPGTAIVLVTYDGINLNYYNNADKKDYLGGEYWGAIWPENTGVFVVTVDDETSAVVPNMTVNEDYNMDALRLAGNNVDAEHDVFYYLDSEEGFRFTFNPENVKSVELASPRISETEAVYDGFSTDGVVLNEDGSWTLLLKNGRNIVRMSDVHGNCVYQVLRAKPCKREITNVTRPGSEVVQPGDKVKIQYSGFFHPANKIAGIYNMSAYVTYNGIPNGSSLILGAGQYTFGSAASAQAVTVEIPSDYDVEENPRLIMDRGVIQVNGYGDPIGNHRNTSPVAGRSPNFTAVPHKTYFGSIPDVAIEICPVRYFNIALTGAPDGAEITLTFDGVKISPDENGLYCGTYGTYAVVASADGYKCLRSSFTVGDDSDDNVVFHLEMQPLDGAWDGHTLMQPAVDEDGVYLIARGDELAWFADKFNMEGGKLDALLLNDVDLGNFVWTPIGGSSKKFSGSFNGAGHSVSGLYVESTGNYQGLFGNVSDADIKQVSVYGSVSGKQYVGGLAGMVGGNSTVDRCANFCSVSGTGTYVGGVVGHLNSATAVLSNCYNTGKVSGTTNCGGVVGNHNASAVIVNVFNVGEVAGTGVGGCIGGSTAKNNVSNAFSTAEYQVTAGQSTVSAERMASGEVAFLLGEAFGQEIGVDPYPVFDGMKVLFDEETGSYFNEYVYPPVAELVIDNKDLALGLDDKTELPVSASFYPAEALAPTVVWTSSDESVVTVDSNGSLQATITGHRLGTATVTVALADNPEIYDTCLVFVSASAGMVSNFSDSKGLLDVYDVSGVLVHRAVKPADLCRLAPGIYIVVSGSSVTRLLIN